MGKKERMRERMRQIKVILCVVIVVVLLGVPAFAWFQISSGAHVALREAKNVKLAMEMLDIEYYGQGTSIYDSTTSNGMKKGAEEEIYKLLEQEGDIVLQSYGKKNRTISAFTYTNDHYEVCYKKDASQEDAWQVRYYVELMGEQE
jgi:flagellar basal body-associated protein FliL